MLTLPIKQKWFDMIESGEKKEEYRAITPYWDARFTNVPKFRAPDDGEWHFLLLLRAGYRKESRTLTIECYLDTGTGRPEWGAKPGEEYFRLHITWKGTPKEAQAWKGE